MHAVMQMVASVSRSFRPARLCLAFFSRGINSPDRFDGYEVRQDPRRKSLTLQMNGWYYIRQPSARCSHI